MAIVAVQTKQFMHFPAAEFVGTGDNKQQTKWAYNPQSNRKGLPFSEFLQYGVINYSNDQKKNGTNGKVLTLSDFQQELRSNWKEMGGIIRLMADQGFTTLALADVVMLPAIGKSFKDHEDYGASNHDASLSASSLSVSLRSYQIFDRCGVQYHVALSTSLPVYGESQTDAGIIIPAASMSVSAKNSNLFWAEFSEKPNESNAIAIPRSGQYFIPDKQGLPAILLDKEETGAVEFSREEGHCLGIVSMTFGTKGGKLAQRLNFGNFEALVEKSFVLLKE